MDSNQHFYELRLSDRQREDLHEILAKIRAQPSPIVVPSESLEFHYREELKRRDPWEWDEGWEQGDPGYYITDGSRVVYAEDDTPLELEDIKLICKAVNAYLQRGDRRWAKDLVGLTDKAQEADPAATAAQVYKTNIYRFILSLTPGQILLLGATLEDAGVSCELTEILAAEHREWDDTIKEAARQEVRSRFSELFRAESPPLILDNE